MGDKLKREEILFSTIPELENKIINYSVHNIKKVKNKLNETILKLKNTNFSYNNLCQKILNKAEKWDNALGDFAKNYNDMIEANTKNADKYFHAKANCQASQRGFGSEIIANILSTSRELEEGTRKVIFEGEDFFQQIQDANQDMKANNYGRELGRNNKNIQCKVLIKNKRPNGLDDKY